MNPKCSIKECNNDCRTKSSPYCEKHYYRLRRTGTTDEKERRYSVNEHALDRLSNDKCWLLGLIWSDGNIAYNRLYISSKDKQMLEDAERVVEGSGCIVPHGEYWALAFSNKRIVNRLRKLGMHESKSRSIGWPNLNSSQEWHFMRGVFDGDGNVYISRTKKGLPYLRFNIVSASPDFFEGMRCFFDKHEIPYNTATRHDGLNRITISRTKSNMQIYENFYRHSCPCLHRKRDIFEQWKKEREDSLFWTNREWRCCPSCICLPQSRERSDGHRGGHSCLRRRSGTFRKIS